MKNIFFLILILVMNGRQLLNAQDTLTRCPEFIEGVNNNSLLNVYPNPSDGTFKVVYKSPTSCPPPGWGGLLIVNIINSDGKTVYAESISNFEGEYNRTIDLSTQEKGFYVIEVISGQQKRVKREVLE